MMFRRPKKILKDQEGSATVEFVLWVPWFCLLLIAMVDASFMYMSLTRMENAARDAARRVSTGQYSETTIVPYILNRMPVGDFTVTTDCSTTDFACVVISRPVNDMAPFGVFSKLVGETFATEVRMRLEPGVKLSNLSNTEESGHV